MRCLPTRWNWATAPRCGPIWTASGRGWQPLHDKKIAASHEPSPWHDPRHRHRHRHLRRAPHPGRPGPPRRAFGTQAVGRWRTAPLAQAQRPLVRPGAARRGAAQSCLRPIDPALACPAPWARPWGKGGVAAALWPGRDHAARRAQAMLRGPGLAGPHGRCKRLCQQLLHGRKNPNPATPWRMMLRRRLAHPLTGGVTLFARNWESRAQLLQLTRAIEAVRAALLICVDHEGGRVQRFCGDGFTRLPAMRTLGAMWMDDGRGAPGSGALRATNAATAIGHVLGAELRACGVDLSFTPVLDLAWGRSSVIGDRALHRDPRVVALMAKSLMHGLLQVGMAHCGKHFPGHGFVRADSHTGLPVDRRSLRAILADDAAPYQWLSSTLASVMPAHVLSPRVDSRPAGFSQRWLQDILRRQLRFAGAIFSDDLGMEGARCIDGRRVSHTDAAIAALDAGCDLVLLCNQGQGLAVDELIAGLEQAQARGRWQPSLVSESRRLALLPATRAPDWDALIHQRAYRQARSALEVHD